MKRLLVVAAIAASVLVVPGQTPSSSASVGTVVPGRLFDSRPGESTIDGLQAGAGRLAADAIAEVQVAGRAGVPADASTVVINVTAVNPDNGGFLTVFPCGGDRPLAASLNFAARQVIANGVTVRVGDQGRACVYSSSATHLVVDVGGYQPADSDFGSILPARLFESRAGERTVDGRQQGGGLRGAGSVTAVQVGGRGGVPTDASVAALNVTAIRPAVGGFLTIFPCGEDRPLAASLTFAAGQVIANNATIKLGADGQVCVYSSAETNLVVDVNGFQPAATTFGSLTPGRLFESRLGTQTIDGLQQGGGRIGAGEVARVQVAGRADVPDDAAAAVLNVAAVRPSGSGFLTVFPCGDERPLAASLNHAAGEVIANGVTARIGIDGQVCIYSFAETDLVVDVNGYEPSLAQPDVPSDLTVAPSGEGSNTLSWSPVDGATSYLLISPITAVSVPAATCTTLCSIRVDELFVGGDGDVEVRAVGADGQRSPAATVRVNDNSAPPTTSERVVEIVRTGSPPVFESRTVATRGEGESLIADLSDDDGVRSAEWRMYGRTDQAEPPAEPEIPAALSSWQHGALETDLLPGDEPGDGVTVAVVDGGIDADHPAFDGVPITDIEVGTSGAPSFHGTAVSSMIVGQPSGEVRGVAPGVDIIDVDVFDDESEITERRMADGIIAAVDAGADVVVISLGSSCGGVFGLDLRCPGGLLNPAVDHAEANGVLVVASAGNNGPGGYCPGGGLNPFGVQTNGDSWPAVHASTISVGGATATGDVWECSPRRDDVDVLAPAAGLLAAAEGGGYEVVYGTSFAAPLLAGVIATILAEQPDLTPAEIRAAVAASRDENGRIVVASLLRYFDIEVFTEIDTTTLAQVHVVDMEISFSSGHPIADLVPEPSTDPDDLAFAQTNQGYFESPSRQSQLLIGNATGTIFVDTSGNITGTGVLTGREPTYRAAAFQGGGELWSYEHRSHGLVCPIVRGSPSVPPGMFMFEWDIPVTFSGSVVSEGPGRRASFDLTVTSGVGATESSNGSLPSLAVWLDTSGECAAARAWCDRFDVSCSGSSRLWLEHGDFTAARDRYVAELTAINQAFIDLGPLRPSFDPRADGSWYSGTDENDERIRLRTSVD